LTNIFALHSPKIIHLLLGEHGEIFGRLEVGWEKVACCGTKAAISLKRVKIEDRGKVTMESLQEVINTLSFFLGRRHISTSGFASAANETAIFALFLPVQPSNQY